MISAVIITYNEERNIARCIASLKEVADEIIVSDSFSADNTVAIAESLGAKVIKRAFTGYGDTKNAANDRATYPWILSIDADEALDEKMRQHLLNLKKELKHDVVYEVHRLNNYCGQWIHHGGWYPDIKPRLFNKTQVQWNLAEVHETLMVPAHFNLIKLEGKLLHYSYTSIEEHRKKMDVYSTRGAKELHARGKKATFIKRYLSPLFRFTRDYIFKFGFLDGKYGWVIASLTAKEVYLKYKKLEETNAASREN